MIIYNKKKIINLRAIQCIVIKNITMKLRVYPYSTFIEPFVTAGITILGSFIMYKYLFNGQTSDKFVSYSNTSDYISYMLVGAMIFIISISTLVNICSNLINEMRTGTFQNIFLTGLNICSYLISNLLERIIITLGEIFIILIVAIPLGLKIQKINIFTVIIALMLTFVGIYNMAIMLWGLMVKFKDTNNILNLCIIVINILCGISFPLEYLPSLLQKISQLIPITFSVNILRNTIILGKDMYFSYNEFLHLLVLDVVYSIFCTIMSKRILLKQLSENII